MITQQSILDSLPSHLRPFVATQDYSAYTARDHAVWRFLMTELSQTLSKSAHPVYLEGLKRTGINLDGIPRIEEMNHCLSEIGWRAVVVDGFVPPAIFMEFQARRVLVIAVDMRSIDHMLYTPAPDIVHESAGHAPFIIDIDYAEYLQRFGELGMRAIASDADMAVYEAIRCLSIVKESPSSSAAEILKAEEDLKAASAANTVPSEAALLARLHWWTVEYGLVGSVEEYKIFGAGLLSSLGESVNCLNDDRVKKLPLTVDAINSTYDITSEQNRLFVAKDCRHLSQVLEEFGRHMCVNQGGASSLKQAVDAATVNTAECNSGLQVSGKFSRVLEDAVGNVIYFNTSGPSQLAYQNEELKGHGVDFHASGFGSPLGRLQSMSRCLSFYTVDELKAHGVVVGEPVELVFLSGVKVVGVLNKILRRDQKNILFTFGECTVTSLEGDVLFDPDWGVFDMAVGDSVVSVYGGSADSIAFPLYKEPSQQSGAPMELDAQSRLIMPLYEQAALLRTSSSAEKNSELINLIERAGSLEVSDWLLDYELLTLADRCELDASVTSALLDKLQTRAGTSESETARLIEYGLKRRAVRDCSSSL